MNSTDHGGASWEAKCCKAIEIFQLPEHADEYLERLQEFVQSFLSCSTGEGERIREMYQTNRSPRRSGIIGVVPMIDLKKALKLYKEYYAGMYEELLNVLYIASVANDTSVKDQYDMSSMRTLDESFIQDIVGGETNPVQQAPCALVLEQLDVLVDLNTMFDRELGRIRHMMSEMEYVNGIITDEYRDFLNQFFRNYMCSICSFLGSMTKEVFREYDGLLQAFYHVPVVRTESVTITMGRVIR